MWGIELQSGAKTKLLRVFIDRDNDCLLYQLDLADKWRGVDFVAPVTLKKKKTDNIIVNIINRQITRSVAYT